MIDVVIFSKNRPLQLFALLDSMHKLTDCAKSASITVIYKYDDIYKESIEEIKQRFESVSFKEQSNFKNDVTNSLASTFNRFCTFLVDDIVFKEPFSFANVCHLLGANSSILTFSMRMGTHLNFCYPINSPQPIPDGTIQNGLFIWQWRNSQGDWGYPISLDGHVFRKNDATRWLSRIDFSNPNQLEDRLQIAKMENLETYCVCTTTSCIVNLPINRVQDEYKNRCGDEDPLILLGLWNEGKRINTDAVIGVNNTSAHFPMPLAFL